MIDIIQGLMIAAGISLIAGVWLRASYVMSDFEKKQSVRMIAAFFTLFIPTAVFTLIIIKT